MNLVHIYSARDTVDAQLLQGFLTSEGLHPTVPGGELNDEFALSRRLAGTLGTSVLVPEEEASRALELVAAWQEQSGDDA